MTHSYVRHDSFTCATWLIHMCDVTPSRVWHDPLTLSLAETGAPSLAYGSSMHGVCVISTCVTCFTFTCATWLMQICDMTHWQVWRYSFTCVTWLIHSLTHSLTHSIWHLQRQALILWHIDHQCTVCVTFRHEPCIHGWVMSHTSIHGVCHFLPGTMHRSKWVMSHTWIHWCMVCVNSCHWQELNMLWQELNMVWHGVWDTQTSVSLMHMVCVNSCQALPYHTYEWAMTQMWMSHVTHVLTSHITQMNESCHTYEWIMSHIWMSHVTHMNESCHTYEWVMSHIWMSHVTDMNESYHTYDGCVSLSV